MCGIAKNPQQRFLLSILRRTVDVTVMVNMELQNFTIMRRKQMVNTKLNPGFITYDIDPIDCPCSAVEIPIDWNVARTNVK